MFLQSINENIITPGLRLLPSRYDSREARAMLLAIGLQESRFIHTSQVRGPAKGYFQFEKGGGYAGVLRHRASRGLAGGVIAERQGGFESLTKDHPLAVALARLLLFTDPAPLPSLWSPEDESWEYYKRVWRPGKPHRDTWNEFIEQAVRVVLSA